MQNYGDSGLLDILIKKDMKQTEQGELVESSALRTVLMPSYEMERKTKVMDTKCLNVDRGLK